MSDYERIASVIRYLDEHHADQPDLTALAAHLRLSPSRFHRLFHDWAGITPKDFLQCLTLAHVKKLLARGQSILNAALEAGLSGPGRLHDLCVTLEAATPGEIKSGGAGWITHAGFAPSPFGAIFVAENTRGICHLSFVEPKSTDTAWTRLKKQWPHARFRRDDSSARALSERVFVSARLDGAPHPLRALVKGSGFQLRVWRALLDVPPGHLVTYGGLAETIGCPNAARAVGTAVAQNPIAYLIPCHRVILATGLVGEYHWGAFRKRAMLVWETASPDPPPATISKSD